MAILNVWRCCASQGPSAIWVLASLTERFGHFAFESADGGDHHCRRLGRKAWVELGRHAGDTPLQNIRVPGYPGLRVDRDLAGEVLVRSTLYGGWEGGWSGCGQSEG